LKGSFSEKPTDDGSAVMLRFNLPNKPMVPTAPASPAVNPLRPLRRHIGQPLGGAQDSGRRHAEEQQLGQC
jgi:hypothetical protein